jgi:hypothetical protein
VTLKKKSPMVTTPRRERGRSDPHGGVTVILALGLGLDSGDLGFPPHSRSSRLRYDPDLIYTAITICIIIRPQSSPWETAMTSWRLC